MRALGEIHNVAVFCGSENIAIGDKDAKFDRFEIRVALEKPLGKGRIAVNPAYGDGERLEAFKAGMHEATFERIEIPHRRPSGNDWADIRLAPDALDLCWTTAHVDAFVIASGDSEVSPLFSRRRENGKRLIGVAVRAPSSDLQVRNGDEFPCYDDRAREDESRRGMGAGRAALRAPAKPAEARPRSARRSDQHCLPSPLKHALTRRHRDFSEAAFGDELFDCLLDDAAARGLLRLTRDDERGQTQPRLARG